MARKNLIVIENLIEDRAHELMLMQADLEGPNKDVTPSQWAQPFAASGKMKAPPMIWSNPFAASGKHPAIWGNRFSASGKHTSITWGPRFSASGKSPN